MSLTVLLSSPRGLLTPSNDCFPFRNGIFLVESISCGSSPTLRQISDFSSVFPASLRSHKAQPSPAARAQETRQPQRLPAAFSALLTPRLRAPRPGQRGPCWGWGLSSWDYSGRFFYCGPVPPRLSKLPSASVRGWGWWFPSYQKHSPFFIKPKMKWPLLPLLTTLSDTVVILGFESWLRHWLAWWVTWML